MLIKKTLSIAVKNVDLFYIRTLNMKTLRISILKHVSYKDTHYNSTKCCPIMLSVSLLNE